MLRFAHRTAGFGLIEVMIAAVILAVGLVGLASLQSRSIRAIQEGDNLVTAAMIAQETAQRMLANKYVTSLGRQGYLAIDLSGAIATAGGVPNWANSVKAANPNILNCYPDIGTTNSCYNPGATIGVSANHITALNNMQLMDQVELRLLAWNSLPSGEIKICFDSSASVLTDWNCDNVATRNTTTSQNLYAIKVRWYDIFNNAVKQYVLQFNAICTNSSSTYCGN